MCLLLSPCKLEFLGGPFLALCFFSLYINDVVTSAEGEFNLFTDDTSVYVLEKSPSALQIKLQGVLNSLSVWFKSWAVTINPKKSALMVLSRNRNVPLLSVDLDGQPISQVSSHKHVGLVFQPKALLVGSY